MSVTAVRRFGINNRAWHVYPQYGSTSPGTEPHAMESCRCTHCEHAAQQSAEGSVPCMS